MSLQVRAGIIPYFIDGNQIYVYLMIPSNPAYGGTEPQIAKGRVEEEGEKEAAIREGEEELGLIRTNINKIEIGWSGNLSGLNDSGYKFVVYMANVKDPKNFGKFHYETGWAGWISEQEINRVRSSQRQIVSTIIQKIKMENPKKESFSFENFFYLTESVGGFNKEKNRPYRRSELIERLQKIVDDENSKGVDQDQIWISFSNVPRLNVYPKLANKLGKSTPTGIFAYPIKLYITDKSAPYAGDRDFIIVFKTKSKPWDIGQPKDAAGRQSDYVYSDKIANLARDLRFEVRTLQNVYGAHSVAELDAARIRTEDVIGQSDIPKKDELIKIAKDIEVNKAIIAAKDRNTINNDQQFIYRVSEDMARQWAEKIKNPNWYIRWNKILQKLGYKNAVDLQHSSAIHGAEPTQGAFLDTTDLEVIDIIHNLQYSAPGTSQYTDDFYNKKQRQNRHAPSYQAGWTDDRIREYSLSSKMLSILSKLHSTASDNQRQNSYEPGSEGYPIYNNYLKKSLKNLEYILKYLLKLRQSGGGSINRIVDTLKNGLPTEFSSLNPNDIYLKSVIPLLKKLGITINFSVPGVNPEPKSSDLGSDFGSLL